MTDGDQKQLGKTLWNIADPLRGAMNADDFRDYMLAFLFLRYLSDNFEAAAQKELGPDYPRLKAEDKRSPLAVWYADNQADVPEFEKQMRRKVHYVVEPQYLWGNITELARTLDAELLHTLQKGFEYRFRKEEPRYSRRVGMEEIGKNDFNLNISRYVSTAEAEDEIVLASVHAELVDLELARKAALDKHNDFLKELGLPLLP